MTIRNLPLMYSTCLPCMSFRVQSTISVFHIFFNRLDTR
jgi:hypothetical protein